MSKRLKRPLSKRQVAKRVLTVSLCILLPVGIYIGYTKVKSFYEERIETMAEEMSGYTVTAYEAVTDIRAGEIITKAMVEEKKTLSGQDSKIFMKAYDIGSQALVDIPKGTELLRNMFQKNSIDNNLRELEFSMNIAGENIKEGDYTDIRLRYADGEDYIVLSKSFINHIDWENGYLYLNLTPEEIHLISSAIVDCYLKTGSYLYTTRYLAASYQEPSFVTYTPNRDVLDLIKRDPNVIEKARDYLNETDRVNLEERLKAHYEQYGSSQRYSFSGVEGIYDNAGSNPLYYLTGKTGVSKKAYIQEQDNVSEQSIDTTGNSGETSLNKSSNESMESSRIESGDENTEVTYAE